MSEKMQASEPLKILIVAPNASSRFGGEAFLPLKYFQILHRRGHPVRLVAHSRNRANLEETLADEIGAVDLIEDTVWHRALWNVGKIFPRPIREAIFGTLLNLVNEIFQAKLIRQLQRDGKVEIIHQPIPVSPKAPSSLYGFGIPVVIGPMNGGMAYPPGYEDLESRVERRFVAASRKLAVALNHLIPGKRKAAALLVANARTRQALPVADHPRVIELVENGVDLSVWEGPGRLRAARDRDAATPFRLVFMGRLVGWKAVDTTLEALRLARAAGVDARLDILGDGEERPRLEELARQFGLAEAVHFLGFRPQGECAAHLGNADALILNSVFECGGAVVLEAMSLGLPIIASDWGGPADYVDESCGILVAPAPRSSFAHRLAAAIQRLAADPALCRRMGTAGAQRIRDEFDWEKKVDQIVTIYRDALKP
ncbi:MAG: glycosyltransferase family 4 protein [Rhodobacteraceae bacterium]|jgi:glycosyltransferase involved in cell wall biosynthesis|nr:glycosyltransferase family 4 protein [Paracoccaceae bacterium]